MPTIALLSCLMVFNLVTSEFVEIVHYMNSVMAGMLLLHLQYAANFMFGMCKGKGKE